MQKKSTVRPSIKILLSTVFLILVVLFPLAIKGELLSASNGDSLVKVHHNDTGEELKTDFKTDQDSIALRVMANETNIYEISFDDSKVEIELNREEESDNNTVPFTMRSETDFDLQEELSKLTVSESSTDSSSSSNEEVEKNQVIKVNDEEDESKGKIYLILEKKAEIVLNVKNVSKGRQVVTLFKSENTKKAQDLVTFEKESSDSTVTSDTKKEDRSSTNGLKENKNIEPRTNSQAQGIDPVGRIESNGYTPYSGYTEYDLNVQSTWLPAEYNNALKFSNSSVEIFNGGYPHEELKQSGKVIGAIFKDFIPGNTYKGRKFGVTFKNVLYAEQHLIDIRVTIDYLRSNSVKGAGTKNKDAMRISLTNTQDSPPFIDFHAGPTINSIRYDVEFLKGGKKVDEPEEPFDVKLPFIFGDTDFLEQHWIENGTDRNMYPHVFKQKNSSDLTIGKINDEIYNTNNKETLLFETKLTDPDNPQGSINNFDNFNPPSKVASVTFSGNASRGHWIQKDERNYLEKENMHGFYFQSIGFIATPPIQISEPKKYVSDSDEELEEKNTLSDTHEEFTYSLDASAPQAAYIEGKPTENKNNYNLKKWAVEDELPPGISIVNKKNVSNIAENIDAFAKDDNNFSVTTAFIYSYNPVTRKIRIEAKPHVLNHAPFYAKHRNIRFKVPVKITDLSKVTKDKQGKVEIKNKISLSVKYFNDDEETKISNEVVTTVDWPNQLEIKKTVDKPLIESGNKVDPADPSNADPTRVNYTLTGTNTSQSSIEKVRILDVLPFDSDGRGSKLSGNNKLKSVTTNAANSKIYFNLADVPEATDPNDIDLTSGGWQELTGSNSSQWENAKAIVVEIPKVKVKEAIKVDVSIQPEKQKAGDHIVNDFVLNSELKEKVKSNDVTTDVHGRDLSGIAWYDDNPDGLMGNLASGSPEKRAEDILVKLYRTSKVNPAHADELVKESLTGQSFIDGSTGESKIKTNSNGEYKFENLPEGDYIVEFVVNGRKVRVTKKLEGSDPTKNSKADQSSAKTDAYNQPLLEDIVRTSDPIHHVENVHIGLIQPSKIRLFKYETGTAVDDGDGQLSDQEKATGTPLKGAEFDIYDGKNKIVGSGITGEDGFLVFEELYPGDYEIIETKAPSGYELIKNPIKVTVKEGNTDIVIYQDDNKATELPFTGGTGPLRIVLIIASSAILFGLGYLLWMYRVPRKGGR